MIKQREGGRPLGASAAVSYVAAKPYGSRDRPSRSGRRVVVDTCGRQPARIGRLTPARAAASGESVHVCRPLGGWRKEVSTSNRVGDMPRGRRELTKARQYYSVESAPPTIPPHVRGWRRWWRIPKGTPPRQGERAWLIVLGGQLLGPGIVRDETRHVYPAPAGRSRSPSKAWALKPERSSMASRPPLARYPSISNSILPAAVSRHSHMVVHG